MKQKNLGSIMIAARVTPKEKHLVQQAVEVGDYMNEADFVRCAVREKLKRRGES